ncbi:hypothetical protein [Psychromonas sp.]|uniref:hypothetical protein n=1 Tax=Psychromonas sp. TaxID=1884585 RepID=UPI003565B0E4
MMSAQMRLKILSFDEHDDSAAITPASVLYMIGAVDEVKANNKNNKERKQKRQHPQQELEK